MGDFSGYGTGGADEPTAPRGCGGREDHGGGDGSLRGGNEWRAGGTPRSDGDSRDATLRGVIGTPRALRSEDSAPHGGDQEKG